MLPSAWRLKKQADFSRVMQGGARFRSRFLLSFYLPSSQNQPRLGITVSKKVVKKAVDRNKLRRQIAELARPMIKSWPKASAGDIVMVVINLPEGEIFKTLALEIDKIKTWLAKL